MEQFGACSKVQLIYWIYLSPTVDDYSNRSRVWCPQSYFNPTDMVADKMVKFLQEDGGQISAL